MIDAAASIKALEERLAATPRGLRPHEHAALAYRLGLAHAEAPTGQLENNLRVALRHYATAAEIFDPRFDPIEHARALNGAGAANRALGRHHVSADQFETAAALLADQGRDDERAAAFSNLGLVLGELGRPAEALAAFDRAVALFDSATAEGCRGRAAALLNRGLTSATLGTVSALESALMDYRSAAELLGASDAPYHRALIAHSVGVACTDLAALEPAHAHRLLTEAAAVFRVALDGFTRAAFPFQHALAKHNLGRALMARGGSEDDRRALACFEDATAVLDPRLHADAWHAAHAGLLEAEAALAARGRHESRAESFVTLLRLCSPDERISLLRERLLRTLALPDQVRHGALVELAAGAAGAEDRGLGIITDELTVLTELPNEHLEAMLLARLAAHEQLEGDTRAATDHALDQAVGDALNGPQRVYVRDFLAAHGFERS